MAYLDNTQDRLTAEFNEAKCALQRAYGAFAIVLDEAEFHARRDSSARSRQEFIAGASEILIPNFWTAKKRYHVAKRAWLAACEPFDTDEPVGALARKFEKMRAILNGTSNRTSWLR